MGHTGTRGDLTAIGASVRRSRKTSSVGARDSRWVKGVGQMSWGGYRLFSARGIGHRDRGRREVAMGVERGNLWLRTKTTTGPGWGE